MFTAALYARKCYAKAAMVSAIPPSVTLVAVLVLSSSWGAGALIFGALFGALLEAIISGVLVVRLGLTVVPALTRPGPEEIALLRGFGLLLVGGILMSANTVVDQAMAASAGAGSVASLGYGAKIPAAVLGLAGVALGTATLPHYATFVASRRFAEMGASLRRHAIQLTGAGIAIAVPLAVMSRPLVRLLFEHGSFLPADTARVSGIQAFYALQIPGYFAGIVAARVLNALGRDRWILWVSCVNFALNVVGDWVLLRWIGLPGIALSTAIVYTVAAVLLLMLCRRAVRDERLLAQTP
jgi:putative peptidoglycan lipid II flippase